MQPTNLRDHIVASYFWLRIGLAIMAIALPFILLIGGLVTEGTIRASMSQYYHADDMLRDVFVGVLFTVGAFLYLYKGYSNLENIALNAAGALVVLVALFPTESNCGESCAAVTAHGAFAATFFLIIAYVCIWRAKDTLPLLEDDARERHYARRYNFCAAGMLLSPGLALILNWLIFPGAEDSSWVFMVEALGVGFFGLYWIWKSLEVCESHADSESIAGQLTGHKLSLTEIFAKAPVK